MKISFRKLSDRLLQMIFPVVCPYCGCVIMHGEEACESCMKKLSSDCIVADIQNSLCVSPFEYDGIFKQAVLNMKFHNKPFYAEAMAVSLFNAFRKEFPDEKPEIITFVPARKKSIRERGYNQSELLAKYLSQRLDVPCCNLLVKVKDNLIQHDLSAQQRKLNVRDVFGLNPEFDVKDKSILIVDDIVTTGSTLHECVEVLRKHGADKVLCASYAATPL